MTVLDLIPNHTTNLPFANSRRSTFGDVVSASFEDMSRRIEIGIVPVSENIKAKNNRESLLRERLNEDEVSNIVGSHKELTDEAFQIDQENGVDFTNYYVPNTTEARDRRLDKALIEGREANPEKYQGIKTIEEIDEEARQKARQARVNLGETLAKTDTFTGVTGSLVGGLGGAFTDPINLATLPFGASAGTSILRAMATEGLINAAIETAEIPLVSKWQKELGHKYGIGESVTDVAFAGVGGAGLAGAIRGVKPAAKALFKGTKKASDLARTKSFPILDKIGNSKKLPSKVRDAAKYMSRVAHIDEEIPLRPEAVTRKDVVTHRQNVEETQESFRNYDEPTYRENFDIVDDDADFFTRLEEAKSELNTIEKPKPLLQFLKEKGGIKEEAGELKFIGIENKNAPTLIRKNGLPLDDAGLRAYEAGYFNERPTTNDLLEAIREDHVNKNVFNDEGVQASIKRQELEDFIDQGTRFFDEKEIDITDSKVTKNLRLKGKLAKIDESVKAREVKGVKTEELVDFRPTEALQSMQRDVELNEGDNLNAAFEADFARLLKEQPDLTIKTEDGDLTIKEIDELIKEDSNILAAIRTCATG